jgi:hypothetical protein
MATTELQREGEGEEGSRRRELRRTLVPAMGRWSATRARRRNGSEGGIKDELGNEDEVR